MPSFRVSSQALPFRLFNTCISAVRYGYQDTMQSMVVSPLFQCSCYGRKFHGGICLYGAELCYVAQNLRNYSFSKETANISRRYHDFLCILIMSLICKRFETEETPYTAETLSDEHKIPIRLTKKILYELQDMHMVYETSMDGDDESIGYLPSVDINRMNVAMLLNRLDIAGTEAFKIDRERYSGPWEALTNAREEYYKSTSKILLKDL